MQNAVLSDSAAEVMTHITVMDSDKPVDWGSAAHFICQQIWYHTSDVC